MCVPRLCWGGNLGRSRRETAGRVDREGRADALEQGCLCLAGDMEPSGRMRRGNVMVRFESVWEPFGARAETVGLGRGCRRQGEEPRD